LALAGAAANRATGAVAANSARSARTPIPLAPPRFALDPRVDRDAAVGSERVPQRKTASDAATFALSER